MNTSAIIVLMTLFSTETGEPLKSSFVPIVECVQKRTLNHDMKIRVECKKVIDNSKEDFSQK